MAWTLTDNTPPPFSTYIDLGTVTSERSNLDAQLFQCPIPTTPSSEALILDLFGAFRTITIRGVKTGTVGEINTFVQAVDGLVNGDQIVKEYHSDKSGNSYNVKVQSASWDAEEGAPTKVTYEITMYECSYP